MTTVFICYKQKGTNKFCAATQTDTKIYPRWIQHTKVILSQISLFNIFGIVFREAEDL